MSTLTIRLPDETHGRLKEIARQRGMSLNKLMEELSTVAITQYDAETRFRALAARGSVEEGLRILDKLDAAFAGTMETKENVSRLAEKLQEQTRHGEDPVLHG